MRKRLYRSIGASAVLAAVAVPSADSFSSASRTFHRPSTALRAGFAPHHDESRNQRDRSLSALTLEAEYRVMENSQSWFSSAAMPVLSASLLITGNTVGAGCLILPELAAGPGLGPSIGIMTVAFLLNLLSGLALAEVAIIQHERSHDETPSSFQEFAATSLDSPLVGTVVSVMSLFVNACVLSFDLSRAGVLGHGFLTGIPSQLISFGWASTLMILVMSLSGRTISHVVSVCVTLLFVAFGGLLIPGLAHVPDPMATLMQPGIAPDFGASLGQAAPVMLMALVYQNIVPSITKLLNYDRSSVVTAISLGSFLPYALYVAWCSACLGGGIDVTASVGGPLLTMFSMATLTGSSLGSILSLSEEVDSYVGNNNNSNSIAPQKQPKQAPSNSKANPWAVSVSVMVPLLAALLFANGDSFTEALTVAGSFGSPVLYGVLPALMAWKQRQQPQQPNSSSPEQPNLVPAASLGLLGFLSATFVGEELWASIVAT